MTDHPTPHPELPPPPASAAAVPGGPPPARGASAWWAWGTGLAIAVAVPFATWALVGDQSIGGTDLDHLWEPPQLSAGAERTIGVVSTLVVLAGVALLVVGRRRGRVAPRLLAMVGLLAAYGAALGAGYRVLTAGVIGANIGGGLVLLALPLLGLGCLAALAVLAFVGR